MATFRLDTKGLRCPHPVLKIAAKTPELEKGDILEVVGDCDTFEEDIRTWCERMGKALLAVIESEDGQAKTVQIHF